MQAKKCSKCKNNFNCYANTGGCWCENIHLNSVILNEIQDNFDNCLCNSYLEEFEKKAILQKK